jgi:hypothetical protein
MQTRIRIPACGSSQACWSARTNWPPCNCASRPNRNCCSLARRSAQARWSNCRSAQPRWLDCGSGRDRWSANDWRSAEADWCALTCRQSCGSLSKMISLDPKKKAHQLPYQSGIASLVKQNLFIWCVDFPLNEKCSEQCQPTYGTRIEGTSTLPTYKKPFKNQCCGSGSRCLFEP